jgi:hypothetical protein
MQQSNLGAAASILTAKRARFQELPVFYFGADLYKDKAVIRGVHRQRSR